MIELVWKIVHLRIRPLYKEKRDIVTEIHWRLEATEQGHQAAVYGSLALPVNNLEAFIPYDSLKEADVIQWVKGVLGADKTAELEQSLRQQLAMKLEPEIFEAELPWVPKSTSGDLV